MGWDTVSNKVPNSVFKDIHWHLLLAYLVTMTAIFGISATAVYSFFYHSRSQQLNKQLLTLVQAAAPSLKTIKAEGRRNLDKDLAWLSLFSDREQGLEWFDAEGELLEQEGSHFLEIPLATSLLPPYASDGAPIFQYQDQIYSVTIAVYTHEPSGTTLQLAGYLRASQSNDQFETNLSQLRLGLGIGGIITLLLVALNGLYLTQQAVKPMRKNFQQLTQFAADASHELRNPLLRISIAAEMMLNNSDQLKPTDAKKLQTILNATDQMKHLIDDVLFLARTDAAHMPLSEQGSSMISLDKTLQMLVERFEPQAQVKGIDFQVQLPASLAVKGNVTQLEKLFSNLLENAIKYTSTRGKVILSAQQNRQGAIVSITDTGIGIPREYLPFIFQRFWRSDQARSHDQSGFGVGLAIAQTIANQHGGKITVDSKPGIGSCFQVYLPVAKTMS